MTIHSSTHKTFGKSLDKSKEKKFNREKPRQGIDRRKQILNKLVNLDPTDEASFDDILKPEEAKAVEKIDDKSIFWAQIMRVILTYTKSNDLSMFINSVEILEVTMGSDVSKDYKNELKFIGVKRRKRYDNEEKNPDGSYVSKLSVMTIERKVWLERYGAIINELIRKGLWSLKGH